MDNEIALLILQLSARLEGITQSLRDGDLTVDEWEADFLRLLAQYLALSMMEGLDTDELTTTQENVISAILRDQTQYLYHFGQEIKATGWQDKYLSRASLYAEAIREPYWKGATECLNLPIVPSSPLLDCGQFCKCFLEIRWIDKPNCSADIYWHTTSEEISPDCQKLAATWRPLRVRNGVMQQ